MRSRGSEDEIYVDRGASSQLRGSPRPAQVPQGYTRLQQHRAHKRACSEPPQIPGRSREPVQPARCIKWPGIQYVSLCISGTRCLARWGPPLPAPKSYHTKCLTQATLCFKSFTESMADGCCRWRVWLCSTHTFCGGTRQLLQSKAKGHEILQAPYRIYLPKALSSSSTARRHM